MGSESNYCQKWQIIESNYCQNWQYLDKISSNMDAKSCQKWQKTLNKICQFWQLNIAQGWRRRSIYAILKQKPYNFTTNTQKAYLSAQASSLSAFVISKTHISGQKPRGRQINTKVCVSKSAIFVILVTTFVQTTISHKLFKYSPSFSHETDSYHNAELYKQSASS